MKKAVLKTILRDFFKLKYPLAMILVVIVLGAGAVWATGGLLTGYRLNHNMPSYRIYTLNSQGAVLTNTSASNDYFIPTKSQTEWQAFLAHCPSTIKVTPYKCADGNYYDSSTSARCSDTCSTCPANHYCNGGNIYACPSGTASRRGSMYASDCRCVPQYPCPSYSECGHDSCGNSCGTMCEDYLCSNYTCPSG